MFRFHLIAEGETDLIVIECALAAILEGVEFTLTLIQPETSRAFGDAGPRGGGWRGVQRKCEQIATQGGLEASGSLANADAVFVHLDGEVAEEPDVACAVRCPPARGTADALRAVIRGWLGLTDGHQRLVICTPMKETEAWLVPILRPHDSFATPAIECRDKPSNLFAGGRPRLLASGRKRKARYLDAAAAMTAEWCRAKICTEAVRFQTDVENLATNLTVNEA